ncbi:unnamed protein product [Rotaria magnacalcarata]|uniref:Beta-lactamase-related domain-containing protein n=1 Tax=Rotaria magnacalcarata TaxID=392030 RepID=A0A816SK05_9BILA|nr:unnamed protein product [Rotaria magnacalcarata]CAF1686349.1 unnamed protein product [Rotaria magnacalcarata]CAF2084559.1 unnamed protein product [Rotaria magnacalcarata]CAF2133924.1 unnamed protein product [Rotaria magnacalcarata]CAF3766831.1 unnamed protein product [Rotaria magnacalcarata]
MLSSVCILLCIASSVISDETTDYNIHGTITPGWNFVLDLFKDNFIHDRDLGASVAVYHQGRLAFELWGGWFDQSKTQPYDNNTLQLVFSSTKGLVAVAVAIGVQRGYLDYSALVTRYWPKYGQNGKENTTVADILSHRAGLPDTSSPLEQYLNWTAMTKELEEQTPTWPPGSAHGYHALTYGWLAGELVRRADPKKRSLGQFIQEEISNPLSLEFYIGLPIELEHRVSPIELSEKSRESLNESNIALISMFNKPSAHQAEIPAGNGITNARSLARLYSSLISDLDNGKYKPILNDNILKLVTKSNTPTNEIDQVYQVPTTFGMGFVLFDDIFPEFGSGTFGHTGAGGSIGFAVPSKNLSFAFVMNRLDTTTLYVDIRIKSMVAKIAEWIGK